MGVGYTRLDISVIPSLTDSFRTTEGGNTSEMVLGCEAEGGVLTRPDIGDCAAIGAWSQRGEETIKVFVVTKPGRTITVKALQAGCQDRMAKQPVPSQLVILDEIPCTPTGKPATNPDLYVT